MALVSVAIVGKDNEPLYLREFTGCAGGLVVENDNDQPAPAPSASDTPDDGKDGDIDGEGGADVADVDGDDPFGFFTAQNRGDESSLRHQFIVHAALDRFEELTGPLSGNRWRTPGATGSDAMWVGLLAPVEDLRVYGYLTNTGIKFMGVIEDTDESGQLQHLREAELRNLFAGLHELYVEYLLNPFTRLRAKIVSRRFDDGVGRLVTAFNGGKSWT